MNVTLHLTTGCNLRCSYCFEGDHGARLDMTPEVARAAVDFALATGRSSSESGPGPGPGPGPGIVFFGGEPLLRRELLVETIAYARAASRRTGVLPHFKVTTNGVLLDDELLDLFVREDVAVSLSIDGTRAGHDRHRLDVAGQGTWARVEERARALLARRPYAPAIMVTTPATVEHAAAGVRHLLGMGFRYLIFQIDYAGAWTDATLGRLEGEYWKMAELYVELTRREEKLYLAPFDVKLAAHIRGSEARGLQCRLGVRQVSVAPDGTLLPCVQFVRATASPEGALIDRRRAIGDVWTGLRAEARDAHFDETEQDAPECAGCDIRERCNRHCGCLSLQTTGTLGGPAPIVCAHERMVTPIADWIGETLWAERAPMFVQKHYNRGFAMLSLVEDAAG